MMLRNARHRCRRRHDQRGTMSLAELAVTMAVGGIALAMASMLFITMMKTAVATDSRVAAETQARQSLTDAMRYLRNAAPLGYCSRFTGSFATGKSAADASEMGKCLRVTTDLAALESASATDLWFFSYPNGGISAQAPDVVHFNIDPNAPNAYGSTGVMTVSVKKANTGYSVFAARCAEYLDAGNAFPIDPTGTPCNGMQDGFAAASVWQPEQTIWTLPVSTDSSFLYTNASGTACSVCAPSEVRLVTVSVGAQYKDSNNQPKTYTFRASASLRGLQYAGSQS